MSCALSKNCLLDAGCPKYQQQMQNLCFFLSWSSPEYNCLLKYLPVSRLLSVLERWNGCCSTHVCMAPAKVEYSIYLNHILQTSKLFFVKVVSIPFPCGSGLKVMEQGILSVLQWGWINGQAMHVLNLANARVKPCALCCVQKCLLVLGGSTCCFVLDIRTHELLDKIGGRRGGGGGEPEQHAA